MSKKYKILLYVTLMIIIIIIIIIIYVLLVVNKKPDVIEEKKYYEINKLNLEDESNSETINIDENKSNVGENNQIIDLDIDEAQLIGDYIYFYSKQENIYGRLNIKENNNKVEILIKDLPVLSEVQLSPFQEKLLYKDYNQDSYFIYDLNTNTKKELNKNIKTALWHPLEKDKIIETYFVSNKNNINTYNVNNDNREELLDLFVNSGFLIEISPNGKNLLYTRTEPAFFYKEENTGIEYDAEPEATVKNFFVLFNLDKKSNILQNENIDRGKFSPNSKQILLSKSSSTPYPIISIYDLEKASETVINLGTYLNKVEFINNSSLVYAKVEENRDNYFNTTLWEYDFNTKQHTQITAFNKDTIFDICNIMPFSDNKKIYFINRYDNKLYMVDIE